MGDELDLDAMAYHLLPETAEATVSIGGSQRMLVVRPRMMIDVLSVLRTPGFTPARRARRPARRPTPPPPPPLPERLGPFTWSPIVFGGGVPVGGWSQLTLFRNGAFNYSGHFHVSGAPTYDTVCVYAVRDADGTVMTFSHKGRVHGSLSFGSRDDDWTTSGVNPAIEAAWPRLVAENHYFARAGANANVQVMLDSAVSAVTSVAGAAATVIAIV